MELNGKLENEDIINYNLYHFRNSESAQKRVKVMSFIGPVIFAGAIFLANKVTDIPIWFWVAVYGIITVAWYKMYPKRVESVVRKNVAKMLEEGDNGVVIEDSKLIVSEEGIKKINSLKEVNIKWQSINKVVYDGDYIYIYDSSISALIIKNNMFQSAEHRQEFIDMLNKCNVTK